MNVWPPSIPEANAFIGAFMHMKENVRDGLKKKDMSALDMNLSGYMRTSNIGIGLVVETEGPYRRQAVVSFETVTTRRIRTDLLHVLRISPHEEGVFTVPTDVAHEAVNGVNKKEASILADELVGGFYEQYEFAQMGGVSAAQLRKISPERYEKQLREIYEDIRQRTLGVITDA